MFQSKINDFYKKNKNLDLKTNESKIRLSFKESFRDNVFNKDGNEFLNTLFLARVATESIINRMKMTRGQKRLEKAKTFLEKNLKDQ